MNGGDCSANVLVSEGEQPTNSASQAFREMQPQRLKQHQMGEVLGHQKAAWLAFAQFLPHPLQRPAHRRLVRFFPDMHDRRQYSEQHAGVRAGERKMTPNNKTTAAVDVGDAADPARRGENREGLNRGRRQIGRQAERPASRQQKAVARLEQHRLGHPFDRKPYLTGDDGVAFDSTVPTELEGEVSTNIKAAGDIAPRPSAATGRQRVDPSATSDDREDNTDFTA
jgi:hypothetical protein